MAEAMKALATRIPNTPAMMTRISLSMAVKDAALFTGAASRVRRSRHHRTAVAPHPRNMSCHRPESPRLDAAHTAIRGPAVRASSPPTIKSPMPLPMAPPDMAAVITGADT